VDPCDGFPLSCSYLYELVNTSENDDIYFVQLVIEIPLETGGTFYWCQLLPPHFHDIHRDYNWFARLHCSLTSSRFKFLAPNGPFFGVSSSWEILKWRLFLVLILLVKIQRTDNGVYSGAQKLLSWPTGGLLRVTRVLNPVSHAGQQRNTVALMSAQLRLGNSAHRGERPRVRIFHWEFAAKVPDHWVRYL